MKFILLTFLVNYNLQGIQYNSNSIHDLARPRTRPSYKKIQQNVQLNYYVTAIGEHKLKEKSQ
jgi:hypothetical protein